ncbi:MAG: hypothetical protein ACI33S_02010 [Bacilli bacterium]
MSFEKEITVTINISKNDLISFFNVNNYIKIDSYIVDDIYYVPNNVDLNTNSLEVLKKSILVRSIDDKKHYLMYKYKEYDEDENIIKQGKSKVQVVNKDDASRFLNTIGYKELIRVVDYIDVYEKDELQICLEDVNNKYLFIEIEENEKYNTIEKMIAALESTGINYDKGNYFVKKAKIIFEEKYRNN